ncbi:MAG: 3-phosphoshikimate 1-carboxyvinyltransferase [Acidimicrobiia bacterium]
MTPLDEPLNAVVRPPGSKSITNRALLCAALAEGTSHLDGVLAAEDASAMLGAIAAIGATVTMSNERATIGGVGGQPKLTTQKIDARQSGTTGRFILPAACLGVGEALVDGAPQLRERPMGPIVEALRGLGADISTGHTPSGMPMTVHAKGLRGGSIELPGDTSSQFLSGLLLSAPCMAEGLTITITTPLVSRPYVDMTIAVMRSFGAVVTEPQHNIFVVSPGGYRAVDYDIEPDASAASYPWAAAAIAGGSVTVQGLGTDSVQGDVAFVDVLEQMGAVVERHRDHITVTRTGTLHGVDVDLTDISDTAPTFAVVAAFADSPSRATGIGFIRNKETDRIAAVVTELRRCGIAATEEPDGFTVTPGKAHSATVRTYDDHRMAMSFALIGLVHEGIAIADPRCVAKTYPQYWAMLEELQDR